jgi:hypothetical protein
LRRDLQEVPLPVLLRLSDLQARRNARAYLAAVEKLDAVLADPASHPWQIKNAEATANEDRRILARDLETLRRFDVLLRKVRVEVGRRG